MHVEVAANVRELEQIRRRIGRVQLAQLGRAEGPADRGIDVLLRGALGQWPQARDVLRRARRPEERRPEPVRPRGDHLDRNPLDGDADGAVVVPLEHGDELRQPLELE